MNRPDLAVSARARFLGRAVMRTRVRTRANIHNPRSWYAPKGPDLPVQPEKCLRAVPLRVPLPLITKARPIHQDAH